MEDEPLHGYCSLCRGAINPPSQWSLTREMNRIHHNQDDCIRELRPGLEHGTDPMSWIEYLLHDAYYHDDKRHRLFYTIKRIARLYEKNPARLSEIERLMEEEIHGPPPPRSI